MPFFTSVFSLSLYREVLVRRESRELLELLASRFGSTLLYIYINNLEQIHF